MAQIHLTAASQTLACEKCGHVNVIPSQHLIPFKATDQKHNSQEGSALLHDQLEQADLPNPLQGHPIPKRSVSEAADDADHLDAVAAANAAKDGKLEQHLQELQEHQAHAHSHHHTPQRTSSHQQPSNAIARRPSLLSQSSSASQDDSAQQEEQQSPQHDLLEQADLPASLTSHAAPQRSVSMLADESDHLDAIAAANAAKDGKLDQHLQELQMHQLQAHVHSQHHMPKRTSSHLQPSGSIVHRSSLLSQSSAASQETAPQQQEQLPQQLPQQSGLPEPHPPTALPAPPSQPASPLQQNQSSPGLTSSPAQALLQGGFSHAGSSSNDGAGTVVFTLKGPTEVILAQIQRSAASMGSGGSAHSRNPSGTPMSRSDVPQMFNVSYPGAAPNLNRPSMLTPAGAEGTPAESISGSPRRDKDNMFRCPICFEDLYKDDVFVASMCGHEMCRGCARQMVLTAISQLELPLACPVCKAGPSPACLHCEEVVRGHTNERYCSIDPDVQLVLSPEEYEDYMDKSMKFASNRDSELTSCPKPDCQGMAVVLSREPIFICPLCNYAWCRRCKCDWHSFQTCDQHQRDKLSSKHQDEPHDKAFQAWLKENRTIACPTCGQGLQKQEGCNHLQCTSCKSHVCWLCGKKIEATTYWEAYTHYWDPESPCYGGTYDARLDSAKIGG